MPIFVVNDYGSGSAYVQIEDNGSYGFFEIEYVANSFSKASGTVKSVSTESYIPNLNNGTYDFYVRANCGGSDFSTWAGPYSFYVEY